MTQRSAATTHTTDALLCAVLRGEMPAWPYQLAESDAAEVLERSAYHGVQALLHDALEPAAATAQGWPTALLSELHEHATSLTMWELRHQAYLVEALASLATRQIEPILFKGTALAYSTYANPVLRTRGDTDLLVNPPDQSAVAEALFRLGFERDPGVRGQLVSYQASYVNTDQIGLGHCIDLHWRINNSHVVAQLFGYDELRERAQRSLSLSPHALVLDNVDALLIACMHRAVHKQSPYFVDGVAHYSGDRLIWLYDLHLLATALTDSEWDALVARATTKGLRAVCLEGLRLASAHFATQLPKAPLEILARSAGAEPIAAYMDSSALGRLWLDMRVLDGWKMRADFLVEKVFPTQTYMRQTYPDASTAAMPLFYLRRASRWALRQIQDRYRDAKARPER